MSIEVSVQSKAVGARCSECSLAPNDFVPGFGPEDAEVVLVGEAPGKTEVDEGRPFVGKSGMLIRKILDYHGIDPEKVYYTNACLCRPPDNDTPKAASIKACRDRLIAEVKAHNPKTILAVGAVGAKAILNTNEGITKLRAAPEYHTDEFPGVKIVTTFHPAAALRDPGLVRSIDVDINKVTRGQLGWEATKYKVVDDVRAAVETLHAQRKYTDLSLDVEVVHRKTEPWNRHKPNWLCIGISHRPGASVVYTKRVVEDKWFQSELRKALASREHTWIFQNGKEVDVQSLWSFAPEARVDEDTILAHFLTDERKNIHDLETMATELLQAPTYKTDTRAYLSKRDSSLADLPPPILYEYNATDCDVTHRLMVKLREQMKEDGVESPYHELLIPGANVLARAEYHGINMDIPYLENLQVDFSKSLEGREAELQAWLNNPRSHVQVKEALSELGYEVPNTRKDTISPIKEEFVEKLLDYKGEHKLLTTYIRGLIRRAVNGKIHPTFQLHVAETGRLSCRNPNVQNIPIGSTIKNAFVAREGRTLVAADYSAIELRLMAEFSEDPYLLGAFRDGRNLHIERALRLYGPDYTERQYVTSKNVVFSSIYKARAQTVADTYNIPIRIAEQVQADFFRQSPKVKEYWKKIETEIVENSYLTSFYGRKRRFWLITHENAHDLYKEGINFKIQSPASDLTLHALIELEPMLREVATPVITVHDQLIFEVDDEYVEDVGATIKKVMEDSPFTVPTPIELKGGKRWGSLQSLK